MVRGVRTHPGPESRREEEPVTARAFILIETQVGKTRDVAAALRSIAEVSSADIITGEFDIIAAAEAADMISLADVVTGQVQSTSGVIRTITCVAA
ncbi:MAG: AsnC family transcriptional regulator [Chloroflexi bacterium]|nr:AsnC family transcriptional regulator [Chloroflexota bacterium]